MANKEETRAEYIARVMDPRTFGIPVGQITSVESINDTLIKLKSAGVNVLGPLSRIDFLPQRHALVLRWAFLDQRIKGEWYKTPGGGGLSMHAVALDKLAQMAAMTWPHQLTYRTDDGTIPLYWRVMVGAELTLMGANKPITKSIPGESDLRDGSAEAAKVLSEGKDENSARGNLMRMRAKGSQRCVSITMAALIRKMLCIRGSYSELEADMPFVWPSTVYVPPVGDAELDRLVAIRELGLADMLYGNRGRVIEGEVRPVVPMLEMDATDATDFGAERDRLAQRETVAREAGTAAQQSQPYTGGGAGGGAPRRPVADEPPPSWAQDPPAPKVEGWLGTPYKLADAMDYFEAKKWPFDPTNAAQCKAYAAHLLTPKGKEEIDALLAAQ